MEKSKTIISPSLLSADFSDLKTAIGMINRSEADWLHCDVMDGVFVPNISFGFPVIQALKGICEKPLDAHFMIVKPERYIDVAAKAGVSIMTVHQEAVLHLNRVVNQIHEAGMKAGVALNPATPVSVLEDIIDDVDMVLIMSVNPGFGGQKFIENTINKVHRLARLIEQSQSKAIIEVDGGVNSETAPRLVKAGANALVSGNYVFRNPNPEEVIKQLKEL
ncbi:MAG TPA: ribulose-phosphate 3-epimerase [Prevotella sp.]|nr:ribulose-phosphate 3-epimerase [Prevotella sp.]